MPTVPFRPSSCAIPFTFPPVSGSFRAGIFRLWIDEEKDPRRHKRFSDEQVIGVLKEHEAGAKVDDIYRRPETAIAHCDTRAGRRRSLRRGRIGTSAKSRRSSPSRGGLDALPIALVVVRPSLRVDSATEVGGHKVNDAVGAVVG